MRTVRYDKEFKVIEFYNSRLDNWNYYIEVKRLGTRRAFIDLLFHLQEKTWVTPETIYDTLVVLEEAFQDVHKKTVRAYFGAYGSL